MSVKNMMYSKNNVVEELHVVKPVANIQEKESEIIVYAEMPGVDKNTVSVEIHGDELTISAKRFNDVPKEYTLQIKERLPVEYKRVFTLGNQINKEHVSAKYEDGILAVTLKKNERTQPKKVVVA